MSKFRAKHHPHLPMYLAFFGFVEFVLLIFRHGHP